MNHRVIRLFLLIFSIIFLVSPNLSAEPTPSSCPAAISSPHLTFTSVPADGGLRAGSITITNSADYPDTLFSCDASGCILVRDIVYEDGTLLLTEGVPNRRELEQKTVILSPDHTGIRVGLYVASCGLSVLSDIIPISYTIPPSAGDEPPTRALTCVRIDTHVRDDAVFNPQAGRSGELTKRAGLKSA